MNTALFENDVELYGTQTQPIRKNAKPPFENDVELYGTQTIQQVSAYPRCV